MSRFEKGADPWSIEACLAMWTSEFRGALEHSMRTLLQEAPEEEARIAADHINNTDPSATLSMKNDFIQSCLVPRPVPHIHTTSADWSRRGHYSDAKAESCIVIEYRHNDLSKEVFVYFDGQFSYRIRRPSSDFMRKMRDRGTPTRGMLEADPQRWGELNVKGSEVVLLDPNEISTRR